MITTVYCMVVNAGDGSAYSRFFDNRAVPEWLEEQDNEAFAESTVTGLEIEHDGPIQIKQMKNTLQTYIDLFDNYGGDEQIKEFRENFFPEGVPEFHLESGDICGKHKYVNVIVDNVIIGKIFVEKKTNLNDLMTRLRGE